MAPTKKKPKPKYRQAASRQRQLDQGGKALYVVLSPLSLVNLEIVKERDHLTNKGAIESSLELNASRTEPTKGRK